MPHRGGWAHAYGQQRSKAKPQLRYLVRGKDKCNNCYSGRRLRTEESFKNKCYCFMWEGKQSSQAELGKKKIKVTPASCVYLWFVYTFHQ